MQLNLEWFELIFFTSTSRSLWHRNIGDRCTQRFSRSKAKTMSFLALLWILRWQPIPDLMLCLLTNRRVSHPTWNTTNFKVFWVCLNFKYRFDSTRIRGFHIVSAGKIVESPEKKILIIVETPLNDFRKELAAKNFRCEMLKQGKNHWVFLFSIIFLKLRLFSIFSCMLSFRLCRKSRVFLLS